MKRKLILNGNPMEETVGFARAVRVVLHLDRRDGAGSNGKTVGVGDVRAQAERCFEIMGAALGRAGSGWQDVVRTRLILTSMIGKRWGSPRKILSGGEARGLDQADHALREP